MTSSDLPFPNMSDDDIVRTGKRFGYGNWLQPIIIANDTSGPRIESTPEASTTSSPPRRSRGRPRVTKIRDESAIEKRRAQVREAQRTYQKRKDTATATEKRRVDELLQLLADLSTDVEALLHSASKAGNMYREDDVSKHIQRLWDTYDTVINNDSVKPELRLQQIKNFRRQTQHRTDANFRIVAPKSTVRDSNTIFGAAADSSEDFSFRRKPIPFGPDGLNFDLDPAPRTTKVQPSQTETRGTMAGKSIFNVIQERQAAMKEADARDRSDWEQTL